MKALAINGSPRKGGNTELLLKKALAPLAAAGWETEFVQLGGQAVRGCAACYRCFEKKDGRCSQTKDPVNGIIAKMTEGSGGARSPRPSSPCGAAAGRTPSTPSTTCS